MADNTPQNGSANIAADDITTMNGGAITAGTALAQRMKVGYGADSFFRDVEPLFPLPIGNTIRSTGTISVTDALGGTPDGTGTPITVAPTASSYVSVAVPPGGSSWTANIIGYVNGTLYTESSVDSTDGINGSWIPVKGRKTGTAPGLEQSTYAQVANGEYRGNCAALMWLRGRLVGATGTPAITLTLVTSTGQGAGFTNSGLVAGNSNIGSVSQGLLANTAVTSRSGTIAVGGTAQALAAANTARNGLTIQNTHATADLWFTEDGATTAALNVGYKLPAGSSAKVSTQKLISIWGATTSQPFAATEF